MLKITLQLVKKQIQSFELKVQNTTKSVCTMPTNVYWYKIQLKLNILLEDIQLGCTIHLDFTLPNPRLVGCKLESTFFLS